MKIKSIRRLALLLCLVLSLSLPGSFTAFAAAEIWIEEPTGWINWGHVTYQSVTVGTNTYLCNWGVRGELCRFRSACALDYYPDLYDGDGFDWCYDLIGVCSGGTGVSDATQSELYQQLHDFLASKQTCTRAEVVTFLWNAAGNPEPFDDECPFEDAVEGKYYYKAMLWALETGVTSGTDDTHFSPKQNCTRGQVVSFLLRAFSSPVIDFGT